MNSFECEVAINILNIHLATPNKHGYCWWKISSQSYFWNRQIDASYYLDTESKPVSLSGLFLCLSLERLLCIIFRSPNALCLRDALLPSACFAALLPLLCSVIFIHTQSRIWQRRIFTSLVLINNHLSNPPSTIEIKTFLPIILWSFFCVRPFYR